MDLQVTQENLNKALNNVARVATGRTTLPILSNVLLKTEDNRLKLSATNLDIAITQYVGTKITKEGSLTIPARLFQDFISNLPKTTIRLKQDGYKLFVEAGNYKSTINGTPVDEYPVMPAIQNGKKFNVPTKAFKKALQQVIFTASSDEARPILTAVYIHTDKSWLFLTGTDSYRLAEKKVIKIDQEVSLLIPNTAMQDLLRIINEQIGNIEILYDDQQVRFLIDDIELIARMINGSYPDYQKLIPNTFVNTALLKKTELITIAKISGLFSRENAGSITVTNHESENRISVKSIASQVGENKSNASGKITGEGSVTLNSRYLLECLQVIDGEIISFCFNGKLEPIIIKDQDDKTYTHVIMPLKS